MKKLIFTLITFITMSASASVKDSVTVDNFKNTDEVLAQVVKKALNVAEKTGDFVIEQAPLLLQEFYMWQVCSAIFFILLSIIIFLAGRYAPYLWLSKEKTNANNLRFFKRFNNETTSYMKSPSAAWILFILTSIVSLIMFSINAYKLVFIMVAPKIYLINYFLN